MSGNSPSQNSNENPKRGEKHIELDMTDEAIM